MNEDIRETVAPLIDAVSKAWDQVVRQVDEVLRWSPGPAQRVAPAVMADGELGEALLASAFGLIDTIDPVRLASVPATGDPRWRFNLPATAEAHVRAMFTEASHAFSLAVIGLRHHASLADLTAVGRLADILVRARWLLEPAEADLRRERAYGLTADAITWFHEMSDRTAAEGDGAADQPDLPAEIADRATTMEARLAELIQEDGLRAVGVPKRRKLFEAYLPGSGLTLYALSSAAAARPGAAPSALFYREPGTGNALYNWERLHVTRAYWLAQASILYADFCDAAAPVLGQHDWEEIISTAGAMLRPLAEEADRRYQRRLHHGLHPGL